MIAHHVYYQLAVVGLLWLCVMLHYLWPSRGAVSPQPPAEPVPPPFKRKRSNEPKALLHRPQDHSESCRLWTSRCTPETFVRGPHTFPGCSERDQFLSAGPSLPRIDVRHGPAAPGAPLGDMSQSRYVTCLHAPQGRAPSAQSVAPTRRPV